MTMFTMFTKITKINCGHKIVMLSSNSIHKTMISIVYRAALPKLHSFVVYFNQEIQSSSTNY